MRFGMGCLNARWLEGYDACSHSCACVSVYLAGAWRSGYDEDAVAPSALVFCGSACLSAAGDGGDGLGVGYIRCPQPD